MLKYNRREVPSQPTGAPLDLLLEIVAPEATTNLFTNPSWETVTTGWTNSSDGSTGTPYARATTYQLKGAYAAVLTIRPTGGTYGQIVGPTIANATQYSMTFHVRRANKGVIRSSMAKAFVNGTTADFDRIVYVADGWWRCEKTWVSTSTNGVGIRVVGSPGQVFYVDAAQLEAKGYCTTYCDGDQPGLLAVERMPAYVWNGVPHASTSSRSAATRAGGRPMNVSRYGLTILALIGLGLSQRSVIATPLGLADGAQYQRTIRESRVFTLAGAFDPRDPRTVSARRGALRSLLSHDLSGDDQPVLMRLQRYDGAEAMGDQVEIAASYLEGLSEEMTQPFSEEVSVQFQQFLPALVSTGGRGTTLSPQSSVADADYIVQRSAAGVWSALGTGMDAEVFALARGLDGALYAGGDFTSAGGVANTTRIAKWDGSAWSALSTGADGTVQTLAVGPDGGLYAGGAFDNVGGGAAARIAKWNGSAWAALGAGVGGGGVVATIAIAPDGSLYAGGTFTTAGGGAAARIAKWDGSAWSALGSGISGGGGIVYSIAIGPDGTVYAGGDFTTAGGSAIANIAKWNGSAWSAVGGDPNAAVLSLDFAPDGSLYAGGQFTTIDGASLSRIARWNGTAWSTLSSGVNNDVWYVLAGPDGLIYLSGEFTTASGLTLPDSVAIWTGSTFTPIPINLPGTATVYAFNVYAGMLTLGYDTSGSAVAPAATSITYPGTVPAGMRVTITGPTSGSNGILYSLTNETTGRAIYFDLTLAVGETAYLTTGNGVLSLETSFRGALPGSILPASDDDFLLVKGTNSLTFYAADSTMTATLSYTPQYESLDDATRTPALQ